MIQDKFLPLEQAPESNECTTSVSYSGSSTITGTARFFKRRLAIKSSGFVLSNPITTPLPIRYAEVQVLDTSGAIVQCGRTDANGNILATDMLTSLKIPNIAGNYTVKILSRSNVTLNVGVSGKAPVIHHISVKKDIYSNAVHEISTVITSTGTGNYNASMTASARETEHSSVPGGAFNILNSTLSMYIYIGQNTSTTDITCVNNKLSVYWQAGFNPAQYIYPSADPGSLSTLSFYNRGYRELYISGGRQGNLRTEDTDHFDDTVILHELGHYLEDTCGTMDSPGGSHYGLYRSDPRLMWSEGWGNFTGVHMLRNNISSIYPNLIADTGVSDGWKFYLDTAGYNDTANGSTTGTYTIKLDLSRTGNSAAEAVTISGVNGGTRYYDQVNSNTNPSEGHFREISIARSLFKGTNDCGTCVGGLSNYADYWKAFEKRSGGVGMGKNNYAFRSSSLFWNRLAAVTGTFPVSIDNILNNDEAQQRDVNSAASLSGSTPWVPYGIKLVKSGSACTLKIRPIVNSGLTSGYSDDQRFNSHFYRLDLSALSGVTTINLVATNTAGTTGINHDLIVYNEDYNFDEDCGSYTTNNLCTSAQKTVSSEMATHDRSTGNNKSISVAGLNSVQKYLLVVKSYTMPYSTIAAGTEYIYTLRDQSGGYICPDSY